MPAITDVWHVERDSPEELAPLTDPAKPRTEAAGIVNGLADKVPHPPQAGTLSNAPRDFFHVNWRLPADHDCHEIRELLPRDLIEFVSAEIDVNVDTAVSAGPYDDSVSLDAKLISAIARLRRLVEATENDPSPPRRR